MTKKLVMIGGPMGVGKTSICKKLYQMVNRSVWLDGDWCWMMHPWKFSKRNKEMVLDHITYLLNNYLKNPYFKVVIFDWILHQENIYQDILSKLSESRFDLCKFSLVAEREVLRNRLLHDERDEQVAEDSIARLKCYDTLEAIKINTSKLTPTQTAIRIKDLSQIENLKDGQFMIRMPRNQKDWNMYHQIRIEEIFEPYFPGVPYNGEHPSLKLSNHFHYCLWLGRQIIGVCHIELLGDGRAAIRPIAIKKSFQNQSLGSQFLKLLEQKIADLGCHLIQLHANPKAITFYERNGYIRMPFPENRQLAIEVIDMGKELSI
ncbi:MAG: GNAT family N-acetyltransferase [Gammaproteobacteria bacterium]|nr:GNAT family N-acetyltransferase [Gammaproteobacteria bacterium]